MKKLIICFAFILVGCVPPGLVEWNGDTYNFGYDFTSYTEKGFLFTPEKYNEPYDAIGLVEILIYPTIREAYTGTQNNLDSDNSRIVQIAGTYYRIEIPQSSVLIEQMYQRATEMGANALTNFRIDDITLSNNNYEIPSLKISGFAIKRHDEP